MSAPTDQFLAVSLGGPSSRGSTRSTREEGRGGRLCRATLHGSRGQRLATSAVEVRTKDGRPTRVFGERRSVPAHASGTPFGVDRTSCAAPVGPAGFEPASPSLGEELYPLSYVPEVRRLRAAARDPDAAWTPFATCLAVAPCAPIAFWTLFALPLLGSLRASSRFHHGYAPHGWEVVAVSPACLGSCANLAPVAGISTSAGDGMAPGPVANHPAAHPFG